MLSYIEFLRDYINIPAKVIVAFVAGLLIMQAIGEVIELTGKAAPGFMKLRKRWKEKKAQEEKDRNTIASAVDALNKNNILMEEIQAHYSADNIAKRDEWMKSVNRELEENSNRWKELSEKLDRNNADTLILKIESMRSAILSLAQRAFDPTIPITHEEFKRVFRIHEEYQDIIDREHLKNGEVEAAMMVVNEGYRERLKTHNFIEDMRGYHGKTNE